MSCNLATVVCGSGVYEARVLPGEALLESNTLIDFVYCSPALRCVQTAQNILKGERRLKSAPVCQVSRDEPCLRPKVCSRTVK